MKKNLKQSTVGNADTTSV